MPSKKNTPFWLSLLLLLAFAGCDAAKKTAGTPAVKKAKTVKKERRKKGAVPDTVVVLVPPGSSTGQVVVAVPAGPLSEEARAGAMVFAARATEVPPFTTFAGKARMRYETDDDSKEFTAAIRIERGKAIWVSVLALGGLVNVARVLLTPDSVKVVNYLGREVLLKAYGESAALLPVPLSFSDLEAFLLGYAPAEAAGGTVTQFERTEGGMALANSSSAGWRYGLNFRSADSVLTQFTAQSGAAGKPFDLVVALSGYVDKGGFLFSQKRAASWTAGEKKGRLSMDWDAPEWNGEVAMPFSVPKNYERK